jgi:hypothetical protein
MWQRYQDISGVSWVSSITIRICSRFLENIRHFASDFYASLFGLFIMGNNLAKYCLLANPSFVQPASGQMGSPKILFFQDGILYTT